MKDETRRAYKDEAYKGKCMLRDWSQVQEGKIGAEKIALWSKCWSELVDVEHALDSPSPDTVAVRTRLTNTMRRVRSLTGVADEEAERAELEIPEEGLLQVELPEDEDDTPCGQNIIRDVVRSSEYLIRGFEKLIRIHPALESLPIAQAMKKQAQEIAGMSKEIARIRGLS